MSLKVYLSCVLGKHEQKLGTDVKTFQNLKTYNVK